MGSTESSGGAKCAIATAVSHSFLPLHAIGSPRDDGWADRRVRNILELIL